MNDQQWYSNKDIYEMVQDLRDELKTTHKVVKEYNGLRQSLNDCIRRVTVMEERQAGRYHAGKAVREWGGWVVAILAFVYTTYKG